MSTLRLEPGAKVVLLDNRFVEGNTFQLRRATDGMTHRVVKNFPLQAELLAIGRRAGSNVCGTQWQYYWAMEYVVT